MGAAPFICLSDLSLGAEETVRGQNFHCMPVDTPTMVVPVQQ